jgi:hypothetical protein
MSNLSFVMRHGIDPVRVTPNVSITPLAEGGFAVAYIAPANSIAPSPPEYAYTLDEAVSVARTMDYSLRVFNQQCEEADRKGRRQPRSYGRRFRTAKAAFAYSGPTF